MDTKPIANSIELFNRILPPHIVAIQLKTLIPVGTAMIMVANMKNIRNHGGVPLVNMWCAHTSNPKKQIAKLE